MLWWLAGGKWRRRWAELWHCGWAAGVHRAAWSQVLVIGAGLGVEASASDTCVTVSVGQSQFHLGPGPRG